MAPSPEVVVAHGSLAVSSADTPNGSARRNSLSTVRALLQFIAVLTAGVTVGVGGTLLAVNAGTFVYQKAMAIGVAVGFAAFGLFILFRLSLTRLMRNSVGDSSAYQSGVRSALVFVQATFGAPATSDDTRRAAEAFADRAASWLKQGIDLVFAYSGAAAAIGIGVGIVGSVISMAAVVAAHRQVDRMDNQNRLIEQQIFEATATRISQLFAAQLPSLLDEIQRNKETSAKLEKQKTASWRPSDDLVARIQALIYATQPYSADPEVSAWLTKLNSKPELAIVDSWRKARVPFATEGIRFSPERGQLLSILVAARFPFEQLARPLDFSYADLRGVNLGKTMDSGPVGAFALGETILRGANFRQNQLGGLDLSRTDLSGAFLPEPRSLQLVRLWHLSFPNNWDPRRIHWLAGAKLHGAIIEVPPEALAKGVQSLGEWAAKALVPETSGLHLFNKAIWSAEVHDSFLLVKEHDEFPVLLREFTTVLEEIGNPAKEIEVCSESTVPTLKALRNRIARLEALDPYSREAIRTFVWTFLGKHSARIQTCVMGRTRPEFPEDYRN